VGLRFAVAVAMRIPNSPQLVPIYGWLAAGPKESGGNLGPQPSLLPPLPQFSGCRGSTARKCCRTTVSRRFVAKWSRNSRFYALHMPCMGVLAGIRVQSRPGQPNAHSGRVAERRDPIFCGSNGPQLATSKSGPNAASGESKHIDLPVICFKRRRWARNPRGQTRIFSTHRSVVV
jgi:hypothetical protein